MKPQSLINHLVEHLRGEIDAKAQTLAWIDAQEGALAAHDAAAFAEAVERVGALMRAEEQRTKRRTELLERLAREWGVSVEALSLGGVARRMGPAGAPLEALRLELRQAVAGVIKRNRRLAALIGLHRRINTDICQLVLGCDNPEQVESGGALIDAEA